MSSVYDLSSFPKNIRESNNILNQMLTINLIPNKEFLLTLHIHYDFAILKIYVIFISLLITDPSLGINRLLIYITCVPDDISNSSIGL